jgi:hypothetical protein
MILLKPKFKLGEIAYYVDNNENLSVKSFKIEQIRIRISDIQSGPKKNIIYVDKYTGFEEEFLFANEQEAKTYASNCIYLPADSILFELNYGLSPSIVAKNPDLVEFNFPPLNDYAKNFLKQEYDFKAFTKDDKNFRQINDASTFEAAVEKQRKFLN